MLSAALLTLAAPACAAVLSRVSVPTAERVALSAPVVSVAAPMSPAAFALPSLPAASGLASLPAVSALASPAASAAAAPALAAAPASAASTLSRVRVPGAKRAADAPAESLKDSSLDFFIGRGESEPVDATASLLSRQRAVQSGRARPLPRSASEHRFLFVPGFSWDALHDYFGPNIRRLRDLGLDARLIETDPLGTSEANAEAVRRAIAASRKPVVLIGHSKGGLDALKALSLHPRLQKKVAKLVLLQSPYRGTAIARWLHSQPLLYATAIAYSRLLNLRRLLSTFPFFRGETVEGLTPEGRAREIADAAPLRRGLKVYSVVSRVDDESAVKILLFITAGAMKTLSGRHNDGLVAPEDAVYPGSRYALLEHVGHLDPVAEPASWKHKSLGVRGDDPEFAADLTEAIVRWAFGR